MNWLLQFLLCIWHGHQWEPYSIRTIRGVRGRKCTYRTDRTTLRCAHCHAAYSYTRNVDDYTTHTGAATDTAEEKCND